MAETLGTDSGGGAPALPVRVIRYGVDQPLPERRVVRAGPLTALLENADLRYVKVGGHEVVRRIYMAVRNRNWDTIAPRFISYEVDRDDRSFRVRFAAAHADGDVDFAWDGRIEGTSDGVITLSLDGAARKDFLKNRLGWCVLHPMALAGTPVEVQTPDGLVTGAFPIRISPHQPFVDMVSITHPAGDGASLTIRFEGDLFEMEDQRNWTDASYKTYSTPLRLPYPVAIGAGQRVRQTVTVEVSGATADVGGSSGQETLAVRVGTDPIGTLPPIGLGAASHGKPLGETEIDRLRLLYPAHLRVELDLTAAGWEERLRVAAADAGALGAALELEVVAGDAGEGLDGLAAILAAERWPLARLLVFPRTGLVTTEAVLAAARRAIDAAGLRVPVGGGSRAYFTELNRATLPLPQMQVAGYAINPQVHAFDNSSLVETLAAQAETVSSARALVGERPVAVGPITLRPRFNPNATGPLPQPTPGELPPEVDPRQMSLLGAGWTVGSIRHLAEAGAAVTYYQTTGWRGVLERSDHPLRVGAFRSRPGMLFPLYYVLADVGEFAGADLLPVTTSDPLQVEALALRKGDRLLVLVASFADERRSVQVSLPDFADGTVRLLDETTTAQAMADRDGFTRRVDQRLTGDEQLDMAMVGTSLDLQPFAIARIEARLTGV